MYRKNDTRPTVFHKCDVMTKGGCLRSVALHQRRPWTCRKMGPDCTYVDEVEHNNNDKGKKSFASSVKELLAFWLYIYYKSMYGCRICSFFPDVRTSLADHFRISLTPLFLSLSPVYISMYYINVYCLELWRVKRYAFACFYWPAKKRWVSILYMYSSFSNVSCTKGESTQRQEMDSVAAWQFGLTPVFKKKRGEEGETLNSDSGHITPIDTI